MEGVQCVDASNAFNSLNRQAALHNIPRVCPVAGLVFTNCYSAAISLYVEDGEKVLSLEGTGQGDPLAMAFYAFATQPLVKALSTVCPSVPQIWYADHDAALGPLIELRCYWDRDLGLGQGFGYLPNAKKSTLLVRRELVEDARQLFDGTGVSVTTDGLKYLGSPIGSDEYIGKYARYSEAQWSANVKACADVAESQPHAAYYVFVSALQRQWSYALRLTEFPDGGLSVLEDILDRAFIPALLGHGEGHQARQLLAEHTQQKLSGQRAWHVLKNHVILCSAVNKNYELRRSTRMYGVHAAAVRSASGKETRVQTRVMQKKKSIANESKASVHSADNCCEYKVIMEVKSLQTEIRNPG